MNDPEAQEGDTLQGFYAYKNTFTKDSKWVKLPHKVAFVVNADPEADFTFDEARTWERGQIAPTISTQSSSSWHRTYSNGQDSSATPRPYGLDALSAATSSDYNNFTRMSRTDSRDTCHPSDPGSDPLKPLNTPSTHRSGSAFSPPSYFSQILNPVSAPAFSPSMEGSIPTSSPRRSSDTEIEDSHEVAFLLRHYAEQPAAWMDLFDTQKYFTNYVPVKAMTNPILKTATCAYAARQLSLVGGRRPVMGGAASTQAPSEIYPRMSQKAWAYKCTQYYDKAVELLVEGIKNGQVGVGRNSPDQEIPNSPSDQMCNSPGDKRKSDHIYYSNDSQMPPLQWKKRRKISQGRCVSDEMTAATAILCDYEQMKDGAGIEWNHHLDGAKSLLDIVASSMQPLQAPAVMPRPIISRARQATFWNFARQDFLSALINNRQTRLDSEDLFMWRDAGLEIDSVGFIRPSISSNGLPGADMMKEDMISNGLVWILGKIINYAVAADTGPPGRESWEGINQAALYEKWSELHKHLIIWYNGLPDTFRPCAQLHPLTLPDTMKSSASIFPEIWYNNPMCASTMQSYHMARMLLLLNMPQQSTFGRTTYSKRLSSYRDIPREIEAHAKAICGIAVSRPEGAVRVHSVQPLFTAGQSLGGTAERKEVIRLLREIEQDTGWTTNYRVRRLLEEWEWPNADGPAFDDILSVNLPANVSPR